MHHLKIRNKKTSGFQQLHSKSKLYPNSSIKRLLCGVVQTNLNRSTIEGGKFHFLDFPDFHQHFSIYYTQVGYVHTWAAGHYKHVMYVLPPGQKNTFLCFFDLMMAKQTWLYNHQQLMVRYTTHWHTKQTQQTQQITNTHLIISIYFE